MRATQFLVMAAKARALMTGRFHVSVEDLRALVLPVLRHRVLTNFHAESDGLTVDDILKSCSPSAPRRASSLGTQWRRAPACASRRKTPTLGRKLRALRALAATGICPASNGDVPRRAE